MTMPQSKGLLCKGWRQLLNSISSCVCSARSRKCFALRSACASRVADAEYIRTLREGERRAATQGTRHTAHAIWSGMCRQCAGVRPSAVRRGAAGRGAGLGRQTEEGGKGGARCGHRGWHSGSRGGASSALSLSMTTVSPRAFAQAGRAALRLLRVDCRGWCAWPRETECPRSQVGWTRTRCPPPGCAAQNQRGTAKSWPDERPCGRAASSPPTTASPATPRERERERVRELLPH
jgi:hypothetical protein